ncbi:MAG: cytochrome c biogenesis protein ResB [Deltaproteobacteria bacterium]|nr:cytochrome c biogenesis protein ResB [Deltaproteobacteria bacterium]
MSVNINEKLKGFYRWFKKPRTTIYILIALVILYGLGLIIPQKFFFDSKLEYDAWLDSVPYLYHFIDYIGFTDIYLSPLTLFALALFFINLLAVTIDRIPILIKRAYIGKDAFPHFNTEDPGRSAGGRHLAIKNKKGLQRGGPFDEYFKKKGWFTLFSDDERRMIAVKNRFAVFGFLLFHLSFLLILAGALLFFYSRFSGYVVLTEGEAFTGNLRQFKKIVRKPSLEPDFSGLNFLLEKVSMSYEGNRRADLDMTLNLSPANGNEKAIIGINRPLKKGVFTILSNNAGVSPLFILYDKEKETELDGAWVSLNVLEGREDRFFLEKTPTLVYEVWFFPDYVVEEGMETSKSHEINNPAFHIIVRKDIVRLAEKTIQPGQSISFDKYRLVFADLRLWGEFMIIRERGPLPLIAGFILAITGLIMRLIFYRKEIKLAFEGDSLRILGKSDLHSYSFEEELDKIEEELVALLKS